jgi:hypothetical protein
MESDGTQARHCNRGLANKRFSQTYGQESMLATIGPLHRDHAAALSDS